MTVYQRSREPLESHPQDKGGIYRGPNAPSRPGHRATRHPHCTWIIYKRLSRRMAADVSLVYLSTVFTILYFSSCSSPSYSILRRSTMVASLSFYLCRLNRPPPGLIALFTCFLIPTTEGCHTGLTRCICLSRSLLPRRRIGAPPRYTRGHPRRVPQEKNPNRNQFKITQCVVKQLGKIW